MLRHLPHEGDPRVQRATLSGSDLNLRGSAGTAPVDGESDEDEKSDNVVALQVWTCCTRAA